MAKKKEDTESYQAGYHRGLHSEYYLEDYSGLKLFPMYLEWLVSAAEDGYYVMTSCFHKFADGYLQGRLDKNE